MVGQETQQVELLEQTDDPLALGDDQTVHLVLDHLRERVKQLRFGRDGRKLEVGKLAHRQCVQRPIVEDGALQPGAGEYPQPRTVAQQHTP